MHFTKHLLPIGACQQAGFHQGKNLKKVLIDNYELPLSPVHFKSKRILFS